MTKTVLITGATAGFGAAAARKFAQEGWRVIGTGRRGERLRALGVKLPESGDFYGYSLALGSADVSLLALTNAYRALAAGGRSQPVRTVLNAPVVPPTQAMDGNAAWHLYKGGFGPSMDGLFQQSNLGIVTRAGVNLMRQPETVVTCHVKTASSDDVGPLVALLRPLLLDGTIQSNAIVGNATVIASMMSELSVAFLPEV